MTISFLFDVPKQEYVCIRQADNLVELLGRNRDAYELGKQVATSKLDIKNVRTIPYHLPYAPAMQDERHLFSQGYRAGRKR